MKVVALTQIVLMLAAAPAAAQRATPVAFPRFEPEILNQRTAGSIRSGDDSTAKKQDHRWEGAVIGAIVVGSGFAYLGHGFCTSSDNTSANCTSAAIKGAVLGIFVGGLLGGLIGGAIPKR